MKPKLRNLISPLRVWRLQAANPTAAAVLRRVRYEGLTYLEPGALLDLYAAVQDTERLGLQGALIEAGTALGGSALVLAQAKQRARPLLLFDAFDQIPPPSQMDGPDAHARYDDIRVGKSRGIGGRRYYGYEDDLQGIVAANIRRYGHDLDVEQIVLVKGYYEQTLQVDQPVALAHIDCDWYESVWVCLERITPYLVRGGRLVIDDYCHWSGCRRAVDDYFSGQQQGFLFEHKSRLHIIRR